MGSIPDCRLYPWLFLDDSSDIVDRPFNHKDIIANDVLTLMRVYGYRLKRRDRSDIARNMTMNEIFKLWEYSDTLDVRLPGEDLDRNDTYTLEHRKLLHEEQCKLDSTKIQSSRWNIREISRYIDVSTILSNPDIEWCKDSMSLNRSVTLEHVSQMDGSNASGSWDYELMFDRSPVHLCIPLVNEHNVSYLGLNPSLSPEDVIALKDIIEGNEYFWDHLSRTMMISSIIRLNDMMECSWTESIWTNASITEDNVNILRQLMNEPDRRVYHRCNIEHIREAMKGPWTEALMDIFNTHPRILECPADLYFTPMKDQKIMLMNSDMDLISENIDEFSHGYFLTGRRDVPWNILERTKLPDRIWDNHFVIDMDPDKFIKLYQDKVTTEHMCRLRWLDICSLKRYNSIRYDDGARICSMSQVTDSMDLADILKNRNLTYSSLIDIMNRRGISALSECHWRMLQRYMDLRELSKSRRRLSDIDIGRRVHQRFRLYDSPVNVLIDLGLTRLIGPNTPGLTLQLGKVLGIMPSPHVLPLDDLCNLGLENMNIQNMDHISHRFRRLHKLGNVTTIVNCFKPMVITGHFHDLDIMTIY